MKMPAIVLPEDAFDDADMSVKNFCWLMRPAIAHDGRAGDQAERES